MAKNNEVVRLLLLILATVVLLPVLLMVVAWPMMGTWGGGHVWGSGMWAGSGGGWVWLVMWLIPLLILLGGGYLVYHAFARPETDGTDAAVDELRLAYARGDLTDEEFEQRSERLRPESKA